MGAMEGGSSDRNDKRRTSEGDVRVLLSRVDRIRVAYNNTYRSGIKGTAEEAWWDESGMVMIENSPSGSYVKKFKIGQSVRVARRENLGKEGKEIRI